MFTAPREGLEIRTGTPWNVAPNTYIVSEPCCKYNRQHYAPFLSSAPRSKQNKAITDILYDPPAIRSKIKYGNSPQFTAARKTTDINIDPEPGEEKISKPRILKPPQKHENRKGRLYVCHMPYTTGASAPSIPTHIDANGYDISDDNDLIKIPPDERDNTLGPAYYDVPLGETCFNTLRYNGCAWSKSKSKRTEFGASSNPGPCEYNVNYNFCVCRKQDEKYRALMRKCCNVPRITCQLICRAKNEDQPGPGYYEVVDTRQIGKPKSGKDKPFIDSSSRFVYKVEDTPGPQQYAVCDCYKLRKDFNVKNVPFLYNDVTRFQNKSSFITPGPGYYETTQPTKLRIANPFGENIKAPFGSNEDRKFTFLSVSDNPSPAQYCIRARGVRCCPREGKKQAYVFKSRVCRFKRPKNQDEPDPASYSIAEAFSNTKEKKSHATGKPIAFHSSEKKFSKIYDFAGFVFGEGTPGVGDYNLPELKKSSGPYMNISPRFKYKVPSKCPGPGEYTLSLQVSSAISRARTTHNARLMREIVKRFPEMSVPKRITKNKRI